MTRSALPWTPVPRTPLRPDHLVLGPAAGDTSERTDGPANAYRRTAGTPAPATPDVGDGAPGGRPTNGTTTRNT
ncbi:hypothetical protein [Streptomyces nigra]|uniref:hypothetical protein n=1 Tax=Streptomyces nigra TaxID=1827580 RepID=UPI0030D18205